jgi:hypothetical protein
MDIGQGAGLATTGGVRPLLPPIVAGALAKADAGIDFSGTDWAFMESWIWIGLLAVLFAAGWAFDRSRTNDSGGREDRPESKPLYPLLCAVTGGLLFAASLADGGETSWPGLIAGAVLGVLGFLAISRLFMRVNQRLAATGDPGTVLGLARDAIGIAATVAVVFLDVLGYVLVVVALVLLLRARTTGGEKYEGLRVLR